MHSHALFGTGLDGDVVGGVLVAQLVQHGVNDAVDVASIEIAVGVGVTIIIQQLFQLLAGAFQPSSDILPLAHFNSEADDTEDTQQPDRQERPADLFALALAAGRTHTQHRDANDGAKQEQCATA